MPDGSNNILILSVKVGCHLAMGGGVEILTS